MSRHFMVSNSDLLSINVKGSGASKSPEQLTLALNTLGTFDFSGVFIIILTVGVIVKLPIGHVLNEFVRTCALPYLEHDSADVRRAAALSCCTLYVRDPICFQQSTHSIEMISDVLGKLITLAIADPGKSQGAS